MSTWLATWSYKQWGQGYGARTFNKVEVLCRSCSWLPKCPHPSQMSWLESHILQEICSTMRITSSTSYSTSFAYERDGISKSSNEDSSSWDPLCLAKSAFEVDDAFEVVAALKNFCRKLQVDEPSLAGGKGTEISSPGCCFVASSAWSMKDALVVCKLSIGTCSFDITSNHRVADTMSASPISLLPKTFSLTATMTLENKTISRLQISSAQQSFGTENSHRYPWTPLHSVGQLGWLTATWSITAETFVHENDRTT